MQVRVLSRLGEPTIPKLLIIILFCFGLLATPGAFQSCRSADVMTTPAEVKTAVSLRVATLQDVEAGLKDGSFKDDALVQVLYDEEAAWKFLRENTDRFTSPQDFKTTVQSEAIAVGVAREKVQAGEYSQPEKVELIHNLLGAWKALDSYYHPQPPQPGT